MYYFKSRWLKGDIKNKQTNELKLVILTSASCMSVMFLITSPGNVTYTDLSGAHQALKEQVPRTRNARTPSLMISHRSKSNLIRKQTLNLKNGEMKYKKCASSPDLPVFSGALKAVFM